MNTEKFKELLKTKEYDFMRTDENLKNMILLTLGGSHAYGTNMEGSDVDFRGIALNTKTDILLGTDFEQVVNTETDTTFYSFNKMINLLTVCNPNTIEILGCRPESYLVLTDIGKELLDNKDMFLSKLCIHTFGGYSNAQLLRLSNKSARLVGQAEREEHILKSIENARYSFKEAYYPYDDNDVQLFIDKAVQEGYDTEIFMNVNLQHYPLRDWANMWNEMKAIVSSYNKVGKRNENAMSHNKLGKHMAHLIRLFMMCIDILEKEEINTFRDKDHDLLMSIRNGEYLDENRQPNSAFYDLRMEYEKRFEYAKANTSLPDKPDYKRINEFKMYVNERIVRGEV